MKSLEDVAHREALLKKLVLAEIPLEEVVRELEENYDNDAVNGEALAVLDRKLLADVLFRYIQEELSGEDIYFWADRIELRDDIAFGDSEDDSGDVFSIVGEIATPELYGEMTVARAEAYLQRLL